MLAARFVAVTDGGGEPVPIAEFRWLVEAAVDTVPVS